MKLTVQEIGPEDFYKDVVRMDKLERVGVKKGDAIELRVDSGAWVVGFLRGSSGEGVIKNGRESSTPFEC